MEQDRPDKSTLIADSLERLPAEGEEREGALQRAVRKLQAFVGKRERQLPLQVADAALDLTRDSLLDLYAGFQLGTFRGLSSLPRAPEEFPSAQIQLRGRLAALVWVPQAREEVFRWSLAGLRHQMEALLREQLQSAPFTLSPGRLFTRGSGRLALALEQALRMPVNDQNPQREFGLYGLRLLFETSGAIREAEFQALDGVLTEWVETYPYFPEQEIRDLLRAMALADLSPAQAQALLERLRSWRDLERYPAERPFADPGAHTRAFANAAGYGRAWTALAALLAPLFRSRSRSPSGLFGEEHRQSRAQINRRQALASALGDLALRDERFFPALLEEIDALLALRANVEVKFALVDALPAFMEHSSYLALLAETLARHGLEAFDEMWIDDLADLRLSISRPALEAFLGLWRRFPHLRWPWQVLENAGSLASPVEDWLAQQAREGRDERALRVALTLHRRLSALHQPPAGLESALLIWLKRRLSEGDPVSNEFVRWLLRLKDEALRRLFLDLVQQGERSSLKERASLTAFLHALSAEVNHVESQLHPRKLAACWLVDPHGSLGSGQPLAERLSQAAVLLSRRQLDAETAALLARVIPQADTYALEPGLQEYQPLQQLVAAHPRLASVVWETSRQEYPMRDGADRRLALARALGHASPPERALLLLADLFHLAVEMHTAWSEAGGMPRFFPELFSESEALAIGTLKAVAQLEPVLPQAVSLLEEILLAQYRMPERGFGSMPPGIITKEVLPLLVNRRLAPQAIPALVSLLEHDHPPEEKYKQRIWQCALQWLSNAATLRPEQQEVVWRVGYGSPLILTRALALLVLGRQRPLSPRTWETVTGLLRKSWLRLYIGRLWERTRLPDRDAWRFLGTGDIFLLAGVAVALTAEWSAEPGLLTADQREALRHACSHAASDLNRSLEAQLSVSAHPNMGKDWSSAIGLARALCNAVGKSPNDDSDWLVRPADLSRSLLLTAYI